jgi:predicted hydrolase (HD superfamily)
VDIERARSLAEELLAESLPQRWAHTQGVARQARRLHERLGEDAELLEAAAWLHDVGYSPGLVQTGLHALDGARYLRDIHDESGLLSRLVAFHSGGEVEAEERGLFAVLLAEFPRPPEDLLGALTACDMTTGTDGFALCVEERVVEILRRYEAEHAVHRAVARSGPALIAEAHRTFG